MSKLPEAMFDMANEVVVALVKSEVPKSVVEPRRFAEMELKRPLTVVEPVTAKDAVEVAPAKVAPPLRVRPVVVALFGNGYPIELVTVTPPVEAESAMPLPAEREVTKLVEVARL